MLRCLCCKRQITEHTLGITHSLTQATYLPSHLWKSSHATCPMNGISRCVCGSMPPGITNLPVASTTFVEMEGACTNPYRINTNENNMGFLKQGKKEGKQKGGYCSHNSARTYKKHAIPRGQAPPP